jgi:beta-1,4-mannosyl-glycoprotein beta-1,4-N-acetylglucosaminyltransferase
VIFDCCLTSASPGETALLELRLRELANAVDVFILVEADRTFAGEVKPFHLAGFLPHLQSIVSPDRLRYIQVSDMPEGPDPWVRERHQREAIWRGLRDAHEDDVIAFSDCDEIPAAGVICRYRPEMKVAVCDQRFCYYWLNCCGGDWGGTVIGTARLLAQQSLSHWRCEAPEKTRLDDGGWHFSFLGGVEGVRGKLAAYSHQELNVPCFRDERWLRVALHTPLDLFRRPGMHWRFLPPEEALPQVVRRAPGPWAAWWKDAHFEEEWISDPQLCQLVDTYRRVIGMEGTVIELGCWEGRSTVALANMAYPELLVAVDTWEGSRDELANHDTVLKSRERDVLGRFLRNADVLTAGNIVVRREDHHAFLAVWRGPIKFCHVDGSHDHASVASIIRAVLPHMLPGGILCGDDFLTAHAGRRDLQGGVERAVRELLPGFEHIGDFWVWQR